ncbi:phage tail spike protein [Virgibacillus dokdonensis]|uniref:Tail spike domain-containing protein n=1 Tax=Virgibacillus dokdonensis TaxID=302167 RepID=A0A2K9J3K9_9BACI|nr:phage tail spike protein [Virgibacillus dokdonensis]AUJ26542.1 hypothetical protein A21D_03508 [Virgibacillus dokdonensis]
MIHLLNGQDTKILDVIPKGNYWGDNHHRSLKSNLEKCEFMTHANKRFSPYLAERNRIIIPGERPESYREFIIFQVHKMKNNQMKVYGKASYLDDIKKSKVIRPGKTEAKSNVSHVEDTLSSTGWLPGNIIYKGIRTLEIENYTNPFAFLKRLASEFELELQFRIELEDYEIVRYVDMVKPTGVWRGREVEFGKDLLNISRKENTADIVTALIGVGPDHEDGTRLEVLVEDKDALKRWGRNGQHLIAYYEPQSTDQNMTKERLRTLTENELKKRVKAVVEYESEIADLGNVAGLRNKEFYFGDQIKIKDTTFNPPLYLEARIHTMDRPFKRKSARKKVTLGDYKDLTEEQVHAIWKSLQDQIRRKISQADLLERTYDKETIDQKDMPGNQAKDKLDAEVGLGTIETTTGAKDKADKAESNAKKFAVPKEVYEQKVQELVGDIANKVDAEWVNGQLVNKANKDDVYTVEELDNKFNNVVSKTTYETDKDGIIKDLQSHETMIRQNETEIASKASVTEYNSLKNRVDTAETSITQNADQIEFKASKNELNQATQRISTAESQINVMAGKLEFKAESSEVNALGERVNSAEITIDGLKSEIEFKADRIELEGFVTANDLKVRGDLEFGGKLKGATGTFSGEVEAAQLIIDNPDIEQDGGVGLRLQTAMWQESTSKPFKRTGHLEFNTLNDALEIYKVNLSGNEVPLNGFRINVKRSEFLGDVVASESLYANRLFAKTIYSSHYPDKFIINDYENGSVSVNALDNKLYLGYVNTNEVESKQPFRTIDLYVNSIRANTSSNVYLRVPASGGEAVVSSTASTVDYKPIRAGDFINSSSEVNKTNIEKFEGSALDIFNQSVIYKYIKNDVEEYGFVTERETPTEIIRGEGVSSYSIQGLLVKSVQELSTIKEQHNDQINYLEMQVEVLMQEINNLKGVS